MIDPVTIGIAFAGAKAAVATIKEAVQLGHDIKELSEPLIKFFTAQGEVEVAAKQAEADLKAGKAKPGSATAQAMEIVLRRKELRDQERELRDMMSLMGHLDLYQEMCQVRQQILDAQKNAEREERRSKERVHEANARRRQLMQQTIESVLGVFLGVVLGTAAIMGMLYLVVGPDSFSF